MKCPECNHQKALDSHKKKAMLVKTILNAIEQFKLFVGRYFGKNEQVATCSLLNCWPARTVRENVMNAV
jgi:hypothetical protein